MRVIVTGGSGKAGAYTVRELAAAGHEVLNADRFPPKEALPGSFIRLDLTDAGEVYDVFAQFKPEGVCHLAANPSPSGFPRQQTFANNVLSTYNVMQAAGDSGIVTRFIYASSEMATGWLTTDELPPQIPFNEEDRVDTPSAYALSKFMGEKIADSMLVRYPQMTFCSLRINNVIPHDAYDILAYRRENFPEGGGNFWSYIDARDVAGAFRAALEGESEGHEVYLIAAADTCLDTPIQEAVERLYGPDANFATDHGEFQSAFDCSKIKRDFGWTAQHSWRDAE
jgi:nucleoside-diphosphate-sugar epimerase